MALWKPAAGDSRAAQASDAIDPFHFEKRAIAKVSVGENCLVGPEEPPRVIVRISSVSAVAETLRDLASRQLKDTPAEGLLVPVHSDADLALLRNQLEGIARPIAFLALELARGLGAAPIENFLANTAGRVVLLREFAAAEGAVLQDFAAMARRHHQILACGVAPETVSALTPVLSQLTDHALIFTSAGESFFDKSYHAVGRYRQLTHELGKAALRFPVWIRNTVGTAIAGDNSFLSRLLEASFLTGSLLCDGIGDLVSIETELDPVRATRLTYNVLQGAGARISKTEFVACPSCGRTLFDLQTTTQRIRERTGHLKGVKIAIMGCIVNGPGEMADADFGYVGGAPGKINLYVGKQCVEYNIPQVHADEKLVGLIKTHGKWFDPDPASV